MESNTRAMVPPHSPGNLVTAEQLPTWPAEPGTGENYRGEGDVRFRAIIRRHIRWIAAVLSFCLVAGIAVTYLIPPTYRARTVLEVLAVNRDFMNNKDIDPNMSLSAMSEMDSYVETQTRLMQSRTVAERVVTSLESKAKEYDLQEKGSRRRSWLGLLPSKPESFESQIWSALGSLKVKAEGQSSLISITVTASTPRMAADVANAVADQHMAALRDARWSTATRTAEFLSAQLDGQRKILQASESELQDYARTTGLIYTSENANESVAAEKLREVQTDLAKAEADRADKQAQLELVNSSPVDSLPQILDDGTLRDDKSRLTDLRRQLADLTSTLTPNHYKVKEVQSQIAALEKQAQQQRSAIIQRIENDYRAAARRVDLHRAAYRKQLELVTNQSAEQVRYSMLKREVDANRDLYQSMLQKIKEATVVAALRASNVRIVDAAQPPYSPYAPKLKLNIAVSLFAGCMLSVLLVLLRERADRTIRRPGESTALLQIPELAVIPSARRDVRVQLLSKSHDQQVRFRRFIRRVVPTDESHASSDVIAAWLYTASLVAESFRSAVASLLLWRRDRAQNHEILVITGAHPSAGKTTAVINLGLGLVESGRRVLLIDGDLRIPRLGKIFGLDTCSGLSDILSRELPATDGKQFIRDTGLPGLRILPSGSQPRNVTQILHSKALQRFIDGVRGEFDFVLIDSSPAIPLADSRLIAQHADGVIFILRAGETTAEQLLALRKCFQQDGTRVFGSILNDWDAYAEDPSYVKSYIQYARSRGA
ncbi:MAG: polysaccharide biosynthesis tyrosine autokinase [Acidobacteriaceae bacterium]|nr:polysaccharide biosynthesis tyrosine autokinase [Acidobacteriaceae bacterium]